MTTPEPQKKTGALNTLRQTLNESEWRDALAAAKAQRASGEHDRDRRDPNQPRHAVVRRCLLRVDRGDAPPGIYVVRCSDISDGGLRLVHGGPLDTDSICGVIIETDNGRSLAVGGAVAWCKPIKQTDPPAYEMGIRFYSPIDADQFIDTSSQADEAA